jgi:hypothetical protein
MSEKYYRGKITYINNEKQIATIEYITGNKSKNIQAIIDDKQQEKYVQLKLIKKPHRFLVGDNVKFIIKKSSAGVFFADHVLYEFNNALEVLINKAQLTNKFLGYIKQVDDQYFIKEIESYLFFPLRVYKYEIPPTETETDRAVTFKLTNLEKSDKLSAELFNHQYTPGFLIAIKQSKKEEPIEAVVSKITPFGLFVILAESEIECKIVIDEGIDQKLKSAEIILGASLIVKIKHLTPDRLVVELV